MALRDDVVAEGKEIDYKLEVGTSRDARKEFLKDVTSFANSSGGFLLVGVDEGPPGLPGEFPGLPSADIDSVIARLENLLRDCVSPRLSGVVVRPVPLRDGSHAILVIRVGRSARGPHVVDFDGHWRFYARNSAGVFQLDVEQLRTSFLMGDAVATCTREFRTSRIADLLAGDLPVRLRSHDMLVVHLIPASAWDPARRVSVAILQSAPQFHIGPIRYERVGERPNLDGFLMHSEIDKDGKIGAYLQLFTSGIVESAIADPLQLDESDEEKAGLWLPMSAFQQWLWQGIPGYLSFLASQIEADFPVAIMVSFLGVAGARLMTRSPMYFLQGSAFDRENMLLPEVLVDTPDSPKASYLRPIFDAVWNAGGYTAGSDVTEDGRLDLGPGFASLD